MPMLITTPVQIPVPGDKTIEEWVGAASTGTTSVSVARMVAPSGWGEPFQTPEFDEVTVVLSGTMRIEHDEGSVDACSGQVLIARAGERIRYSNPHDEPCEYLAVCVPAFDPSSVHREAALP